MDVQELIDKGYSLKEYPKYKIIYEPGMLPKYVYFIKTGEVRMVTVSKDGKEFIQGIFKSGQYFGEPALIVDRIYLPFTIASKDSAIVPVNKEDFFKLIEKTPGFSIDLIKTLSNRLFYKSMMLEELANEKAEHRLLTIINHLISDIEIGDSLKVTRQELADMTGLRVETVIREIKLLRDKGLVRTEKGKIVRLT